MSERTERLLWWLVLGVALGFLATMCAQRIVADELEDQTSETATKMLDRNNAIRRVRGLSPHVMDSRLRAAAQEHASYMARHRVMSHYTNGSPSTRAAKHGFVGGARENIAYGYNTVDQVFGTWAASGGHMANITSGTDLAGFGWAIAGDGTPYWCAVYGSTPSDSPPSPSPPYVEPPRRFLPRLFRARH